MRFSAVKWLEDAELYLRLACFPQEPQTPPSLLKKSVRASLAALEVGRIGKGGQGRRPSSRPKGIWISLLTDMSTTRYRSLCFPKNSY